MTKPIYLKTGRWTIAELMNQWQLTRKQIQTIRRIIYDQEFDLTQFKSVNQSINECYNRPDKVDQQLTAINEIMDGFGIESITVSESLFQDKYYWNAIGLYINLGDTYKLTIVYNVIDRIFEINSWGEFYESMEYQLEKELNKNLNYD